jgi:hypothetical protein
MRNRGVKDKCDPKVPLLFAGLAAQKNYMTVYLMSVYGHKEAADWFTKAWAETGKKLDMGKSCVRFKKVEDLALDVIGQAVARVPAKKYIEYCEAALKQRDRKRKPKRGA